MVYPKVELSDNILEVEKRVVAVVLFLRYEAHVLAPHADDMNAEHSVFCYLRQKPLEILFNLSSRLLHVGKLVIASKIML